MNNSKLTDKIDQLESQNRALVEALAGIVAEADDYWKRKGSLTGPLAHWMEQARQALSNSDTSLYSKEQAVIDAAIKAKEDEYFWDNMGTLDTAIANLQQARKEQVR